MIIKVNKETVEDLRVNNEIFNLNCSEKVISGVSYSVYKSNSTLGLNILLKECAQTFLEDLEDNKYYLWIFVFNDTWKEDNKINNFKQLWKSKEMIEFKEILNNAMYKTKELKIKSQNGIKFGCAIKVEVSKLPEIIKNYQFINKQRIMFVSKEEMIAENYLKKVYEISFLKKGISDLDWSKLAVEFLTENNMLIKLSGAFDDLKVCLDVLYKAKVVK